MYPDVREAEDFPLQGSACGWWVSGEVREGGELCESFVRVVWQKLAAVQG